MPERKAGERYANDRLKHECVKIELGNQRENFLMLRNQISNGYSVPQKTEVVRYAIYKSILLLESI